jgi:hypothetical protein
MNVFQQFRVWARRAPVAERAIAATAAVLVLAVVAWLLAPANSGSKSGTDSLAATNQQGGVTAPQSGAAPTASAPGVSAPAGSAPGQAGAPTSGAAPGVGGSQATGPGAAGGTTGPGQPGSGCSSPPGSDQGVTSTQIKVAIILINLVGQAGNGAFGLPPTSTQRQYFQDVINDANAHGGTACRKLVPVYYEGNPADSSNLQQLCLQIEQAHPFFVIDLGAYTVSPAIASCYPQAGLPFFTTAFLPAAQVEKYYPYMFSSGLAEAVYRNAVFGLKQNGFFGSGFHKLGVIYRDCVSEVPPQFFSWLRQAGLASSDIVSYDFGCPAGGYASPSDMQAAIVKFKQAGVTNMTEFEAQGDFANFTNIAQQQGFRPRWGIPDEGIVAITYGSTHPDYQNIANAIAITPSRYGEEHTPNYPISAGTARCNAAHKAGGQPPVYQQPDALGGIACNAIWTLQAAAQRAPSLRRTSLAQGLQAAHSIDDSYPNGPGNFGPNRFTGSKVTYGYEYWRTDKFLASCNCWRVVDRTFHPSF